MKTCTLFILLTTAVFSSPRLHDRARLEKEIDSVLARVHGHFAVAFKDLRTGNSYYRDADERFHAASTMKTAVMIEVFNQVHLRKFSLRDSLEVINRFSSLVDGSPYVLDETTDSDDSLYAFVGKKLPIGRLVTEMITVSSNLAADLLVNLVGPANVRRTMLRIGAQGVRVIRGVEDTKAYEHGKNNTVSARALAIMFEQLARKKVINKRSSEKMIQILLQQKFNTMIPRWLPRTVKVAHKTGSSEGIQHDSGIVFLSDGRSYVLVVLSKDLYDAQSGVTAIAGISKIIYDCEVR